MSIDARVKKDSVDLTSVRTLSEIKEAFAELSKEEEIVEYELEQLLSQQAHLESELRNLSQSAVAQLTSSEAEAVRLSNVIGFTAKLADGVAAKVKQLDLAKSRVSDCQNRVNDLIDLQLCSDGVKTALEDEDYEQAAAHLHRFLSMDESLLKLTGSSIGGLHGSVASLDAAIRTLHDAEEKVKLVISHRFDEAVQREDLASVERFFKIFPLINMHEEGLRKFTKFLSGKLVETGKRNLQEANETPSTDPRSSVIFADTLTLLFEGIARTIEIHQPLIETYYGPGRLMTVLFMLQSECDKQAEQILKQFRRKRNVADKLNRVKEMAYSLRGTGSTVDLISGSTAASKLAAKDMDHVLGEMSLLYLRTEMYFKFFRKRSLADIEVSVDKDSDRMAIQTELDRKILATGLCQIMQDLVSDYILLEDFFMTSNVKRALEQHQGEMATQQENFEASNSLLPASFSSLMLDDVFFIVKKCVRRALSSNSIDGACAVANNACTILETEFCGLLQTNLRMGFPSGYLDLTMNVIQTSFQQGYKIAAAQATGDSDKQRAVFLFALNCAESAADYVTRLSTSLQSDLEANISASKKHDREKVETCLAGFPNVASRLKVVLDQGLQLLRQSAVKPRIKPWLDSFVSHDIDEYTFSDYEANDPFVQNLILNLNGLLEAFKRGLTPANYDGLVAILTSEVTAQLEKAVFKTKFSRLGGLLLDREVRSLVSYLSSVTTWSIREKFARLTHMATVLNVESVSEVADIWGGGNGNVACQLTQAEVRQVLNLRTDFKPEEIRCLRL